MNEFQEIWGDKTSKTQAPSTALSNLMAFLIIVNVVQLVYNLYLLITKTANTWQTIIGSVVLVFTIIAYSLIGNLSSKTERLSEDNAVSKLKIKELEKRIAQLEQKK